MLFIGIPSAGIKGELASIGYILSIRKINSWLNSSGIAYGGAGFSRLTSSYITASDILDDVNIDAIDILDASTAKVQIYADKRKSLKK